MQYQALKLAFRGAQKHNFNLNGGKYFLLQYSEILKSISRHPFSPQEWELTSSHRFRSGDDMQFAFALYHFLMSEKASMDVGQIFDEFDTDDSGTWSDREIRTLLARVKELSELGDRNPRQKKCHFSLSPDI